MPVHTGTWMLILLVLVCSVPASAKPHSRSRQGSKRSVDRQDDDHMISERGLNVTCASITLSLPLNETRDANAWVDLRLLKDADPGAQGESFWRVQAQIGPNHHHRQLSNDEPVYQAFFGALSQQEKFTANISLRTASLPHCHHGSNSTEHLTIRITCENCTSKELTSIHDSFSACKAARRIPYACDESHPLYTKELCDEKQRNWLQSDTAFQLFPRNSPVFRFDGWTICELCSSRPLLNLTSDQCIANTPVHVKTPTTTALAENDVPTDSPAVPRPEELFTPQLLSGYVRSRIPMAECRCRLVNVSVPVDPDRPTTLFYSRTLGRQFSHFNVSFCIDSRFTHHRNGSFSFRPGWENRDDLQGCCRLPAGDESLRYTFQESSPSNRIKQYILFSVPSATCNEAVQDIPYPTHPPFTDPGLLAHSAKTSASSTSGPGQ
ncbi:uncharacterized protein LOC135808718 [Sycon ciliatum]|uniref:uncharacterized protein LOC135808718 n=1 Tax=Sycon ciliatum TaxID=27933 RepID=UPI0031F62B3E